MVIALMDQYSDEEFLKIVQSSISYKDCLSKLGYNSYSGDTVNRLKKRIDEKQIDISHFLSLKEKVERNPENVFIKDSTADQKTLRKYYKQGCYSEYKCAICGQEPFWNNKELTLILDHINGYNKDNRLENLRWVCPNCNYQLDTTNGKNKNHQLREVTYCIDCGKIISKGSKRCQSCANKITNANRTQPLENIVSREELKKLIRFTSFTTIGQKFNVSDNAIRKWCDKYNLPRRVADIKAISDSDWEKI